MAPTLAMTPQRFLFLLVMSSSKDMGCSRREKSKILAGEEYNNLINIPEAWLK